MQGFVISKTGTHFTTCFPGQPG